MLNHSVHAQEDLMLILQTTDPSDQPLSKIAMRDVCQLLESAVKFELPDNGIVMDRFKSLEILEPSELQLPFPVVALEYSCPDPVMDLNMIPAKKRIALCFDYEANANRHVARQAAGFLPAVAAVGGIIVVPCYYSETWNRWCIVPWMCILLKDNVPGVKTLHLEVDGQNLPCKLNVSCFPCLPELITKMICKHGPKEANRCAVIDTWDEVMAVITMITALSCSNVVMKDHAPPDDLNKKRLKKGKVPFCGYKELAIINHRQISKRNGDMKTTSGRSVRPHLRRGHVRRLPDGRRIWVESCAVNSDRGEAASKYRVKPVFSESNQRLAA